MVMISRIGSLDMVHSTCPVPYVVREQDEVDKTSPKCYKKADFPKGGMRSTLSQR